MCTFCSSRAVSVQRSFNCFLIIPRNKAVADGAISFYLDHSVGARVSKFSYGTNCNRSYNHSDIEHAQRSSSIYIDLNGQQRIPNCFDVILPKVREPEIEFFVYLLVERTSKYPKPRNFDNHTIVSRIIATASLTRRL